jgi:thiol-disulfide isomerase/thioredoxin
MAGFLDTIYYRFISPYIFIISVSALSLLFLIAAYYAYNHMMTVKPEDAKLRNLSNVDPNGRTITLYMFHVSWCPHCKVALPEWKRFKDEYHERALNGYTLLVNDVDCTDENSPQNISYMEKYKIESFPTILAVMDDDDGKELKIDFDAKANFKNLEKFAQTVSLGNNTGL